MADSSKLAKELGAALMVSQQLVALHCHILEASAQWGSACC
jgi:hypothetical protein